MIIYTLINFFYVSAIGFIIYYLMWNFIINPIIKMLFLSNKKQCEGCGEYKCNTHNYYGYNSCSEDCDDFLDDLFLEMKY